MMMGPFGERMIQITVGVIDGSKPAGTRQLTIRFRDFQRWMRSAQQSGLRIEQVKTISSGYAAPTLTSAPATKQPESKPQQVTEKPKVEPKQATTERKNLKLVPLESEDAKQPRVENSSQPGETSKGKRSNRRRSKRKAS